MTEEVMYCVNHPDRETLLRCNKCGKPICPECAIRHPVGLRCRECAQLRRIPTYELSLRHYALALAAGLPSATVSVILGGIFSRLLSYSIPFIGGFIPWIIAFAVGILTAEVISRATGYKRGRGLQVVAAICIIFGYFIGNPLLFLATTYLLTGIMPVAAFWTWLNFYNIIYLLLAILATVERLR
jgi:hypothetical protein